jgi:hypothetical protein
MHPRPHLHIEYHNPGQLDIATVRAKITRLAHQWGRPPDVLIVDYPEKMRGASLGDKSYGAVAGIYDGLKAIAADFNVLIIAPSQLQRMHLKRERDVIRKDNIDASWAKAHIADAIISVNQTYEEYRGFRMRIWVDKVRRGEAYRLIPCHCYYASMQIIEMDRHEALSAGYNV